MVTVQPGKITKWSHTHHHTRTAITTIVWAISSITWITNLTNYTTCIQFDDLVSYLFVGQARGSTVLWRLLLLSLASWLLSFLLQFHSGFVFPLPKETTPTIRVERTSIKPCTVSSEYVKLPEIYIYFKMILYFYIVMFSFHFKMILIHYFCFYLCDHVILSQLLLFVFRLSYDLQQIRNKCLELITLNHTWMQQIMFFFN